MWLVAIILNSGSLDTVTNVGENYDCFGFVSSSWSQFHAQGAVDILDTHVSWTGLEAKLFQWQVMA